MSEQTPGTAQAAASPEGSETAEPEAAQTTEPFAQPEPDSAQTPAPFVQPEAGIAAPLPDPVGWAYAVPFDPNAVPAQPAKPKRRFPWRWVGATVLTLAVGAGCAFGVMSVKRTDVPGLATAADGRYDFAPLVLPTLAPGQSDPNSSANEGGQHLSDIRKLLLPAPEGATPDASLPGSHGWVSESATLALMGSEASAENLVTDGWRHTAGVAWKTPDGAQTEIYLVQYIDSEAAGDAQNDFVTVGGVNWGAAKTFDVNPDISVSYATSVRGATTTWYGELQAQDTEFLIVYKAPSSVGLAPFEQEADLQVELLQ